VIWDSNSLGTDLNTETLKHKALLLNTWLLSPMSLKECTSSYFVYITIIFYYYHYFLHVLALLGAIIREKTDAKLV